MSRRGGPHAATPHRSSASQSHIEAHRGGMPSPEQPHRQDSRIFARGHANKVKHHTRRRCRAVQPVLVAMPERVVRGDEPRRCEEDTLATRGSSISLNMVGSGRGRFR